MESSLRAHRPKGQPPWQTLNPSLALFLSLDGLDPAARLEHVDRFRNESAAAHVARFGLRVAVLDVALFVLELPDLDDEEVAVFRTRHSDPYDLFFGHSRVDGEGRLKRLRVCGFAHSGRSTASGTRARSSMRVSPTGAYGKGTGGVSKNVGLTMSTPSGRAYC